jgi:hypothetical protein
LGASGNCAAPVFFADDALGVVFLLNFLAGFFAAIVVVS